MTQTPLDPGENTYYLQQIWGMEGKILYPEVATSLPESTSDELKARVRSATPQRMAPFLPCPWKDQPIIFNGG